MADTLIFLCGMLAMFVIVSIEENHRQQRPQPQIVAMVGWCLFSLSSTLAALLGAVVIAIAFGAYVPLQNFERLL